MSPPGNEHVHNSMELIAYLDEAGIHGGTRLTVMAGWIADADRWQRFEIEWGAYCGATASPTFMERSLCPVRAHSKAGPANVEGHCLARSRKSAPKEHYSDRRTSG
jgi:hypothetical protein